MNDYQIAVQLRRAGIPRRRQFSTFVCPHDHQYPYNVTCSEVVHLPSRGELIDACGEQFGGLEQLPDGWHAWGRILDSQSLFLHHYRQASAREALATLYLSLQKGNKKVKTSNFARAS